MSGLWVRGIALFLSLINKSCKEKSFSWRQTANVQRRRTGESLSCCCQDRDKEDWQPQELPGRELEEKGHGWVSSASHGSVHQANWVLCLLKIRTKAAGTSLGVHCSQYTLKAGQGCSSPTQVSSAPSSYRAQETEKLHMVKHVLAATGQSKLSKQTETSLLCAILNGLLWL